MAVEITNEQYNGLGSLYANAGDYVEASFNFTTRFNIGSGTTNKCTYFNQGNNTWLEFQNADFGDFGFLQGDVVDITFTFLGGNPNGSPQSFTRTVTYIDGNQMYIDAPLGPYVPANLGATVASGSVFPTDSQFSGILIVADRRPNAVEIRMNLAPNGSFTPNSVIDGQLNRFELLDTDTIGIGVPTPMTQLGNQSGGWVKDVTLEYDADGGSGFKDFIVTYKFWQWGVIQSGVDYYENADHIAPLIEVDAYALYGNPNGILSTNSTNTEGNTGGRDENYNDGVNNYAVQSIDWFDVLGDPISALDYSNPCTFEAIISAPNQNNPLSTYRMGLLWAPEDTSFYKERSPDIQKNLIANFPEVDFIADGVLDPTIYQGQAYEATPQQLTQFPGIDGARWDFQDIQIEITGVDELTITGKVIPNFPAFALFEQIPDGGRLSILTVSIGNYNNDGTNISDRVQLTLFGDDNINAPTKGVQIQNVLDEFLFDHAGNDITVDATAPDGFAQTTTEDDVKYESRFQLIDNVEYQGLRCDLQFYNTVTEDVFELGGEDFFFSFINNPNVAFINGQYDFNFAVQRGFNLPPSTDRNVITIERDPTGDAPGLYGVKVTYGYLSDWRYWIEEPDVDNDFFDLNESFNGKNKNWQRLYSGDWRLRASYYTIFDGVEDFNHFEIGIRPYEDDVSVSHTRTFTVVSTGDQPNDLPENEIIDVESVFTWTGGTFSNPWVEETIENFESGNRWVMSSVLPQGNIAANPLKTIPLQTVIDLTIGPPNVLTALYRIDTSLINVDKVSISHRVYSEDEPPFDYLITIEKEAEFAFSLRRLSSPNVYASDKCITVRRSHDNAEMDIDLVNDVLFVGDQSTVNSLIWFVTENGAHPNSDGFVVEWFDQSGNINNAPSIVLAEQPRIVSSGAVEVDPDNGLPALFLDGSDDNLLLDMQVMGSQLVFGINVFNRSTNAITSIPAGGSGYPLLWLGNDIIYTKLGAGAVAHDIAQNQTGDFLFITSRTATDDVKIWRNSIPLTTINYSSTNMNIVGIGQAGGFFHNGYLQESVYYKKDKEADLTTVQDNVNNFYSIY